MVLVNQLTRVVQHRMEQSSSTKEDKFGMLESVWPARRCLIANSFGWHEIQKVLVHSMNRIVIPFVFPRRQEYPPVCGFEEFKCAQSSPIFVPEP